MTNNYLLSKFIPGVGALFVSCGLMTAALGRHFVNTTQGVEILHSTSLILLTHGIFLVLSNNLRLLRFISLWLSLITIAVFTFALTTFLKAIGVNSLLSHLTPISGSILIFSWIGVSLSLLLSSGNREDT